MRTLGIGMLLCATALSGCGKDKPKGDDGSGAGGSAAGNGTAASGGDTAGAAAGNSAGATGGNAGSAAGNGAGTQAGAGPGTDGGKDAGTDGSKGDAKDGGKDAGQDGGKALGCRAPEPAETVGNSCPGGAPPTLKATLITDELKKPVFVTAAPGDDTRLFIVDRSGEIFIWNVADKSLNVTPFIDVPMVGASSPTSNSGESGLLGMAFHPQYPGDPRFFVNHTDFSGDTVVRSFEVSAGDPDIADDTKGEVLITFGQPMGNHNGGMIAFGPDDCLYIGSGDGGNSNDTGSGHPAEGNGQNLDTPLGKLLRMDVDNKDSAAPGNMVGGHEHIWDYGLRNPWRFSFDRDSGDLYIGDVGQGAWEEVNVAPRGVGHKNWGWKIAEGDHCRVGGCDLAGLDMPVDEYANAGSDDCMVGGYVYRGSAIADLNGWYLYGDNGSSKVRAFVWDGAARCNDMTYDITSQVSVSGDISSFGEDADGEMYITTIQGSLYKIEAGP